MCEEGRGKESGEGRRDGQPCIVHFTLISMTVRCVCYMDCTLVTLTLLRCSSRSLFIRSSLFACALVPGSFSSFLTSLSSLLWSLPCISASLSPSSSSACGCRSGWSSQVKLSLGSSPLFWMPSPCSSPSSFPSSASGEPLLESSDMASNNTMVVGFKGEMNGG